VDWKTCKLAAKRIKVTNQGKGREPLGGARCSLSFHLVPVKRKGNLR